MPSPTKQPVRLQFAQQQRVKVELRVEELRSSILRLQAEEAQLDATINTTQQQSRNILGSLEQPLMSETSRKSTPHDISQRGLISKPTEGVSSCCEQSSILVADSVAEDLAPRSTARTKLCSLYQSSSDTSSRRTGALKNNTATKATSISSQHKHPTKSIRSTRAYATVAGCQRAQLSSPATQGSDAGARALKPQVNATKGRRPDEPFCKASSSSSSSSGATARGCSKPSLYSNSSSSCCCGLPSQQKDHQTPAEAPGRPSSSSSGADDCGYAELAIDQQQQQQTQQQGSCHLQGKQHAQLRTAPDAQETLHATGKVATPATGSGRAAYGVPHLLAAQRAEHKLQQQQQKQQQQQEEDDDELPVNCTGSMQQPAPYQGLQQLPAGQYASYPTSLLNNSRCSRPAAAMKAIQLVGGVNMMQRLA